MGTELKGKYDECVKNKRIKTFSDGPRLIGKELGVAKKDLEVARKGLVDSQWKWSIIQAYYAMFHAARALLFAKSLNEHSHYCLSRIPGMRHFFHEFNLVSSKNPMCASFLQGSLVPGTVSASYSRPEACEFRKWRRFRKLGAAEESP
ncbi:MAG: HEPN domain-containing protein [Pseudomonadota bacterium]